MYHSIRNRDYRDIKPRWMGGAGDGDGAGDEGKGEPTTSLQLVNTHSGHETRTHMHRDLPIKISKKNTGRQPHAPEMSHARQFQSYFPCMAMQESESS